MGSATAGSARPGGGTPTVELRDVAAIALVEGPAMIRSEDGVPAAYVQANVRGRDAVGFVEEAMRAVDAAVPLPPGVRIEWSGEFEHHERAARTLLVVVPASILLILLVLYLTYRDLLHAGLVLLAVPGALAGGLLFQAVLGEELSVAAWVGFVACFGMATETGIVMLVYLRGALERVGGLDAIASEGDLRAVVLDGAVRRLRPKLLTEATILLGLAPMLWAEGIGSEVTRPMVVPLLGGILLADEVIDILLPALFFRVERRRWHHRRARGAAASA
jgi:Cu(I)/Ag(I) efflux system membrane protein CusA/SilA